MNHLIIECNELLKNQGFKYAICGGFALWFWYNGSTIVRWKKMLAYQGVRGIISRRTQVAGFDKIVGEDLICLFQK